MLQGKIKGTITVPPLVPPVSRRSLQGSETKPRRIQTESARLPQRPVGLKRGPAINTTYALELFIMVSVLLVMIYLWTASEGTVVQIVRWLSHP